MTNETVVINDQIVINIRCYELGMRSEQCVILLFAFDAGEISDIYELRVALHDFALISNRLSLGRPFKQLELEVFNELLNPEWDLEYVSSRIFEMKKIAARACDEGHVKKWSFELGVKLVDCAESFDFDMAASDCVEDVNLFAPNDTSAFSEDRWWYYSPEWNRLEAGLIAYKSKLNEQEDAAREPVLQIRLSPPEIQFEGRVFTVCDEVACWFKALYDAGGYYVSFRKAGENYKLLDGVRSDRLKKKIPKPLQGLVKTESHGSRLIEECFHLLP